MAASMKVAVFWVVTLCSLVEVYQHFRGSKYLWNVNKLLADYMALQPRTRPSSKSLYYIYTFWSDINVQ
jgi:hypothetical protein